MFLQLQTQPGLQHLADHARKQPVPPGQRHGLARPRPGHQLRRQVGHHRIGQHQPTRRTSPHRRRPLPGNPAPGILELAVVNLYRCHLDLSPSQHPRDLRHCL